MARLSATRIDLVEGRLRILERTFAENRITLESRQEPLKLGARHYRGRLHVHRGGATLKVVNEVDLETYLLGVVGAEIGSGSPIEAIKAQSVAARGYAAASVDGFPSPGIARPAWDVYDDTRSQVYVGVPAKNSNVERAVRETSGLMIFYRSRIVRTYFSSACGGHTMGVREWTGAAEIPPLAGVKCGWCAGSHEWSRKFSLADLGTKFKSKTAGKPVVRLLVKEATSSGRPSALTLELAGGRAQLSAKEVDQALSLPTSLYAVSQAGDVVTFAGAGYGHGVGLCQTGTIEMARKGWKFDRILAHYFPQAQLLPGTGRK